MPSLILCAEILDYLGDAATTKLVFVVFRAFVGFVHDTALSASVMADEKTVVFLILAVAEALDLGWQPIKRITAELSLPVGQRRHPSVDGSRHVPAGKLQNFPYLEKSLTQ